MSKKIILRQSVKSGVAVVFFFGLGMASINAQTKQPTGKVGINTTEPTETLDVKGKVRIQELYTDNQQTGTNNNATFTATNVVTVDNNGVLGKKPLSSIIMPTIPTEPWQVAGGSIQATTNTQNIYQNGKVGIGDYSAKNSTMESSFEINGGGSKQLGLINGTNKWDISTENKALTFTKRKPDNGRIFSVTQDAKLFLGNNLLSEGGSNAKVILDGGNGKIGINQNSADYNLDVAGDAKISGLKTTDDNITDGSTTSKYSPAKMVVVDKNGVLGKQDFPTIPTMPTIPTEPWRQLGSTTQATANTDNIYQNGKVGIGNYTDTSTFDSDFEVNSSHNGYHVGIANGADTKWNLSAESGDERAFTITKRHKDGAGRLLSITKEAKLFLGNTLTTAGGGNTKITLDGKDGNIILIDKWRVGLKGNSLMFYNSSTTGDSNNKFTLTNEGKLFLGKGLNGDGNGTGANILLDGKDGKVAIGKNSANYTLDVNGDTGIKGQLNLIDSSDDNNKFLTYTEGTQLLFDKKITVPLISATTTQTGVMASLTNVGKLYLGSGLTKPNGETLYTKNANILLDGQDGKVAIGKNSAEYNLDVKGNAKISGLPDKGASDTVKMVVVDDSGVLKKAAIPTGGGSGNGVTKHTTTTPTCNAANAGTIHYKEGVTVNGQPTSVMGFCMKTADNKYRWFYIFGGAGTTTGSAADTPNFGDGL